MAHKKVIWVLLVTFFEKMQVGQLSPQHIPFMSSVAQTICLKNTVLVTTLIWWSQSFIIVQFWPWQVNETVHQPQSIRHKTPSNIMNLYFLPLVTLDEKIAHQKFEIYVEMFSLFKFSVFPINSSFLLFQFPFKEALVVTDVMTLIVIIKVSRKKNHQRQLVQSHCGYHWTGILF